MYLINCLLNTYPHAHRQVLYKRTFLQQTETNAELHKWSVKRIDCGVPITNWYIQTQLLHLSKCGRGRGNPKSQGPGCLLWDGTLCIWQESCFYGISVWLFKRDPWKKMTPPVDVPTWMGNFTRSCPSRAWMTQLTRSLSLREILLIGYLISSNRP